MIANGLCKLTPEGRARRQTNPICNVDGRADVALLGGAALACPVQRAWCTHIVLLANSFTTFLPGCFTSLTDEAHPLRVTTHVYGIMTMSGSRTSWTMNELYAEGTGIVLYAMSAFAGSNTLCMDMMSLMTAFSTPS